MIEKSQIRRNINSSNITIKESFIYWAKLGYNIGHEQNKTRPILVVKVIKNSGLIVIVPISSKKYKDSYKSHIDLDEIKSSIIIEQIKTISINRIISPYRRKGKDISVSKDYFKYIKEKIIDFIV